MSLLLVIIYLAFISLGLPDALLGSAWPSMQHQLSVPVSYAGYISTIIAIGTIISSLFSARLTARFGTGRVTAVSVAITAAALFGFSATPTFLGLCVLALPYGLGAGAVDAALNNYVALHYQARHMSWLHCFWGIGATSGPYIMGLCLAGGLRWNSGYIAIAAVQAVLTAALLLSLPLWRGNSENAKAKIQASQAAQPLQESPRAIGIAELVRLPGASAALVTFFCYCAMEMTAGLWGASYMVMQRGISAEDAARWASLYYLGITAGRFLSGFVSMRLGDRGMVRFGLCGGALGAIMLLLPGDGATLCAGLVVLGVGSAPIYPSLLHATPANFGATRSQAIMGMQMACAYMGTTLVPPVFGLAAEHIGVWLYPFFLLALAAVMAVSSEILNHKPKHGAAG